MKREAEEDPQEQLVWEVVPRNTCVCGRGAGSSHSGFRVRSRIRVLPDADSFLLLERLQRINGSSSFSLPWQRRRWCLGPGDQCCSVGVHSLPTPSFRRLLELRLLVLLLWDNTEVWGPRQGSSSRGMTAGQRVG